MENYLRVNLSGPGPRPIKKNLPGRGLTKVEKHWCRAVFLNPHTVRLLTEGDDTRGCGDTTGPPDDEQRAARNMLRSVV